MREPSLELLGHRKSRPRREPPIATWFCIEYMIGRVGRDDSTRAIRASVTGLPMKLLLAAVEQARERGVQVPAEAHLVAAALSSSLLTGALDDVELDWPTIREAVELRLDAEPPASISVTGASKGTLAVGLYGGLIALDARATVLAALPKPHSVDPIDVFVAALFDPHSLTSRAVEFAPGASRLELLARLSTSLGRYAGIQYPLSRVASLPHAFRVSWALRDNVSHALRRELPPDFMWMCRRDGDELLIRAESEMVGDILAAEGYLS